MERDTFAEQIVSTEAYFNSRAHVERDYIDGIKWISKGDFNSRAHVERDI